MMSQFSPDHTLTPYLTNILISPSNFCMPAFPLCDVYKLLTSLMCCTYLIHVTLLSNNLHRTMFYHLGCEQVKYHQFGFSWPQVQCSQ
jgi:hypothetical protein